MKYHHILKAAALATALTATSASADSPVTITLETSISRFDTGYPFTGYWGQRDALTVLWNVHTGTDNFLAFCIDPTVTMNKFNNSYALSPYSPSDSVKRLYELFYPSILANSTNAQQNGAFQLALWELQNDDGNLSTGNLYFNSHQLTGIVLGAAGNMLNLAQGDTPLTNTYQYGRWISEQPQSQMLLSVTAIPEPATWAMLLAGLGVAGFARIRSRGKDTAVA